MEQNERRSETERHWDNLAMTTITAAPAAVFLIARNGPQEPGPAGDLDAGTRAGRRPGTSSTP